MSHPAQLNYLEKIRRQHPEWFTHVKVLEVGSLDINGTIRGLFDNPLEYVGVDVGPGRGVDLIENGENLTFPNNSFDLTISCECFEHNPEWAATFQNMHRMSNKAVIFTCASEGRPEHGTRRSEPESSPHTADWDYYRNLTQADFEQAFNLDQMFSEYAFEYNPRAHDLYFYGVKR